MIDFPPQHQLLGWILKAIAWDLHPLLYSAAFGFIFSTQLNSFFFLLRTAKAVDPSSDMERCLFLPTTTQPTPNICEDYSVFV